MGVFDFGDLVENLIVKNTSRCPDRWLTKVVLVVVPLGMAWDNPLNSVQHFFKVNSENFETQT